jgi:hypothetical protein
VRTGLDRPLTSSRIASASSGRRMPGRYWSVFARRDDYSFMLTARDCDARGGGGTDEFGIKIWEGQGSIIYDNQVGEHDDPDAATEVGGRSIVVHRGG